jgi:hypothetical protein
VKARIHQVARVALLSALISLGVINSSSAAPVAANNNAICNQTVGSAAGVSATRLSGGDCLVTFTTAGVANNWTAPVGVSSIQLLVVGGGGGGGIDGGSGGGGGGAYQTSGTAVTPSSVYNIYVGNGGGPGIYSPTAAPTTGESSTITINGTLYAGLGGAAAANGISTNPQPAAALGGSFLGSGGTGTTGATGGTGIGWTATTGPAYNGNGGNLTSSITDTATVYGGSGAGGGNTAGLSTVEVRYGGAGGGGNSTYVTSGTFTAATSGAANTGGGGGGGLSNSSNTSFKGSAGGGSGIVIIRYTPNTSSSVSINIGAAAFVYRQSTSISASTGFAGVVNFKANGKYIPGCRNRPSNVGNSFTATCSFKPAIHNSIAILALFTPTDSTYQSSSVSATKYSVQPRSGNR